MFGFVSNALNSAKKFAVAINVKPAQVAFTVSKSTVCGLVAKELGCSTTTSVCVGLMVSLNDAMKKIVKEQDNIEQSEFQCFRSRVNDSNLDIVNYRLFQAVKKDLNASKVVEVTTGDTAPAATPAPATVGASAS